VAIRIPFLADVADFLRGTGDLETALEGVIDSLDDVSVAGDDVDQQVGQDFTGLAKTADTEADKIERSFRDAFNAVEEKSRTSTGKVSTDIRGTGEDGSQALRDFKEEAKQNVAESVSSFTGSAESAVDAVQSTFGGLVSSLGPAGVVGAAVVGVGIGLARGLFEKAQERAQQLSEDIGTLAGELINLGLSAPGAEQVTEALQELATTGTVTGRSVTDWVGTPSTKLLDLRDAALEAGIGFDDLALGVAGQAQALETALGEIAEREAAINTKIAESGASSQLVAGWYADETKALNESKEALQAKAEELETAAEVTRVYEEAQRRNVDSTEAVARAAEAGIGAQNDAAVAAYGHADANDIQAAAAQDAADALAAKNTEAIRDAELTLAASDAAIGYEQALDDATEAIKTNGQTTKDHGETLDINSQKGRDNQTALNRLAGALRTAAEARQKDTGKITTYNRVISDNREEFIKAARAAGLTKEAAEKLATSYGLIPKTVKTEVTDDGSAKDTQKRIDDIHGDPVKVPVSADMSAVDREIKNYFNGKTYAFDVAPRPGHSVAK